MTGFKMLICEDFRPSAELPKRHVELQSRLCNVIHQYAEIGDQDTIAYIAMAYIVMAYIVMAFIVMAYVVMLSPI